MQQSKTKRFFKRIERFIVSCKQYVIVRHLLFSGGKEVIANYKHSSLENSEQITDVSPIWVCWWQGRDSMPDIVKACYNSILMHAGNHPVILITGDNYHEYVTLPDCILQKWKAGNITLTHLSDILRMLLLKAHGGIWMDSTVLLPCKNR